MSTSTIVMQFVKNTYSFIHAMLNSYLFGKQTIFMAYEPPSTLLFTS